jgi:hypothetical protein
VLRPARAIILNPQLAHGYEFVGSMGHADIGYITFGDFLSSPFVGAKSPSLLLV